MSEPSVFDVRFPGKELLCLPLIFCRLAASCKQLRLIDKKITTLDPNNEYISKTGAAVDHFFEPYMNINGAAVLSTNKPWQLTTYHFCINAFIKMNRFGYISVDTL